jgi:hypothetical protein
MIRGVRHISITAADRDRLVAFYRDLEVVSQSEWNGGNPATEAIFGLTAGRSRPPGLRCRSHPHLSVRQ